jgi:glycosyltransferase involved in cell wall biosynthesis
MKVGIYAGSEGPQAGGGYTLVQELLGALGPLAAQARHQFVRLTTDDAVPSEAGNLPVLSVAPVFRAGPGRSLRARAGRMVADALGGYVPRSEPSPHGRAVGAFLGGEGIEFVWYLGAGDCLTLDVPYATVVWDLQHRMQPFFPEVSANGLWQQREDWHRVLLGRASLIVTGTEAGRREVEHFYGVAPERVRVLPHPTPSDCLASDAPSRPRLLDPPYLFYPAQFWPHKNHVNLIEALRLVREQGLDLHLVLTGSDKGNEAHVRAAVQGAGLERVVHFRGFVSRSEVLDLHAHALALVYPSLFGPENMPPLEAFALGCPVIAAAVSGADEQLGGAAYLVDATSPRELAAAIQAVATDTAERARRIEAGRARARRFTPADYVRGILSWLDEFEGMRRCWPVAERDPGI